MKCLFLLHVCASITIPINEASINAIGHEKSLLISSARPRSFTIHTATHNVHVPRTRRLNPIKASASSDLHPIPNRLLTKDIIIPHGPELVQQRTVGSCHAFAFTELLFPHGLKISKRRLFLDHLLSVDKHGPDASRKVFDVNLEFVKGLKGRVDVEGCRNIKGWEGGHLEDDLKLVQTVGGVVVPHNQDWEEVVRISEGIHMERLRLSRFGGGMSDDVAKERLANAGLSRIIEMALDSTPQIERERQMVREVTRGMYVESVLSSRTAREREDELIEALAMKGAVYLGVDHV